MKLTIKYNLTTLLKYGHNRHSTLPRNYPTRSNPQPHFARISAQTLTVFVRAQLHFRAANALKLQLGRFPKIHVLCVLFHLFVCNSNTRARYARPRTDANASLCCRRSFAKMQVRYALLHFGKRPAFAIRLRHSNAHSKSGTRQLTPFGCMLSGLLRTS